MLIRVHDDSSQTDATGRTQEETLEGDRSPQCRRQGRSDPIFDDGELKGEIRCEQQE